MGTQVDHSWGEFSFSLAECSVRRPLLQTPSVLGIGVGANVKHNESRQNMFAVKFNNEFNVLSN